MHLSHNSPFYLSQNYVENNKVCNTKINNPLSATNNLGKPFSTYRFIVAKCSYNFRTIASTKLHSVIFKLNYDVSSSCNYINALI